MGTPSLRLVDRRWFLTQTGRGVLGIAVLGLAACSDSGSNGGAATSDATQEPSDTTAPDSPSDAPEESGASAGGLEWSRVDLGFVSAYVLVRGREAAVVDTGVGGSADAIGAVLDEAGPGWAGVRHVVLTHKHPDHAGSVGDVLTEATDATGYVGRADLPEVDAPRALQVLEDGDDVLGLRIVATPGHTAGHLAVFDEDTGVLVAGDALNNDGQLSGSNPQFTEDGTAAAESVRVLAGLAPRTILVGHGPPVVDGAADALRQLAASL
ncbi:MAG TPA: MBL fold metallo-hydrolase [Nocardioides sp.]|uniref:MBL fold metallo-hydrolase n=1 Tax=Nocardioides sp. TaxID=35761 RepID=UPI002D806A04|nr:MBL fold metallo-hydrolase [Nocardioides sp.]HET6654404.1 MBL fold metallo-hydrolase [Nocardioides sp.]